MIKKPQRRRGASAAGGSARSHGDWRDTEEEEGEIIPVLTHLI